MPLAPEHKQVLHNLRQWARAQGKSARPIPLDLGHKAIRKILGQVKAVGVTPPKEADVTHE